MAFAWLAFYGLLLDLSVCSYFFSNFLPTPSTHQKYDGLRAESVK